MAYTNIDDPSAHFQTALYTGTGSAQSITNDGNSDLKPDWVWIKNRSHDLHNVLFDSSRGVNNRLISNLTIAEDTGDGYGVVSAFNTDGFTVNPQTNKTNVGGDGYTYVGWQWKANGGTTTSVSESSYNAGGTYQKNETAGFSIVSYTGIDTVGEVTHGLTTQPQVVIVKRKDDTGNWATYHESAGITGTLFLNTTAAKGNTTAYFHTGWGSATKFPIGSNADTNADGATYVAYVFSERQGYSKFGKYFGNGSSTNGPFVYLGFKPAFIMWKNSSAAGEYWHMRDTARDPHNQVYHKLFANLDSVEDTQTAPDAIDILSNGFKLRAANTGSNGGNRTYIYMAFAENPFVTSTGIPTTAR